jgi:hypothetical protein
VHGVAKALEVPGGTTSVILVVLGSEQMAAVEFMGWDRATGGGGIAEVASGNGAGMAVADKASVGVDSNGNGARAGAGAARDGS